MQQFFLTRRWNSWGTIWLVIVFLTTNWITAGQTETPNVIPPDESARQSSVKQRTILKFPDQKSAKTNRNPCLDPVLLKARKEGLRSVKIYEIPTYFIRGRQCRKNGASREAFRRINQQQLEVDFTNGHRMQGWTSCWTYLAASTVLFYFLESAIP